MIPQKYPHVDVDHFIVMPNHMHGIVIIDDTVLTRGEKTSPLPTLGNIIAWFKYDSTKRINNYWHTPCIKIWQRNYYERIIRSEKEYIQIVKYIINNPLFWDSNNNPIKL